MTGGLGLSYLRSGCRERAQGKETSGSLKRVKRCKWLSHLQIRDLLGGEVGSHGLGANLQILVETASIVLLRAYYAKERDWQLSPAYDLTPMPQIAEDRRDLAMEIGDQGRFANAKNILSQHARFLLDEAQAKAIGSKMTDQVRASWYNFLRTHGVTEKDAETIRDAFVYEGFLRD